MKRYSYHCKKRLQEYSFSMLFLLIIKCEWRQLSKHIQMTEVGQHKLCHIFCLQKWKLDLFVWHNLSIINYWFVKRRLNKKLCIGATCKIGYLLHIRALMASICVSVLFAVIYCWVFPYPDNPQTEIGPPQHVGGMGLEQ